MREPCLRLRPQSTEKNGKCRGPEVGVSDQGQCRGRRRLRGKLQEVMPTQDSWQVNVTWRAPWMSEDQHYFSEGNEPSPRNVMQRSEVTDGRHLLLSTNISRDSRTHFILRMKTQDDLYALFLLKWVQLLGPLQGGSRAFRKSRVLTLPYLWHLILYFPCTEN